MLNVLRGNKKQGSVAVGIAILAGVMVSAPSAQALPFGEGGKDAAAAHTASYQRMMAQQPLIEAADQVRKVIESGNYPGFAGIELEDKQVALSWKGELPQQVRKAVVRAEKTAPIRVAEAKYSLAELRSAAAKVRAQIEADRSSAVHTVQVPSDGSGLELQARPGSGLRLGGGQHRWGVAVTVVEEAEPSLATREDDSAPWSGGAVTHNEDQGTLCTAGFGVANDAGAQYMATAAHCGEEGHRIVDGQGEWIWDTSLRHEAHDVALIPTSDVTNFIYTGPLDSDDGLTVEGWQSAYTGQILCQAGMTSQKETGGPVCNLEVVSVNGDEKGMVEAEQLDGADAARPGDSGGPVYAISESGNAVAVGITSAVAGSKLIFQDFQTLHDDFHVNASA